MERAQVKWEEVHIRSDHPPHDVPVGLMKSWELDRGKAVRIGAMIDRETALKITTLRMNDECKCEQFFMVHPDDAQTLYGMNHLPPPCWICRGFLEMD
jgi:hypothetical protein